MNVTVEQGQSNTTESRLVLGIGFVIWILFAAITFLGGRLHYEIPNSERPILLVTTLLVVASILAVVSLRIALRIKNPGKDFFVFVILFSIAFRLIQLFSPPFQEIDSYRYIWDGLAVVNGHNPYRYSPYQVLHGKKDTAELAQLHDLSLRSETYHTILNRVHYSHVRTLYPPVSQAVFSIAVAFVPSSASVDAHLIAMKTAITLFDLGVLFLLAYLLSRLRLNIFWCMAYGWNPLVIKEFSNSGHLDSIAVFFVLASLTLLVRFVQCVNESSCRSSSSKASGDIPTQKRTPFPWLTMVGSGLCLAAGLASKIYPIILLPICLITILKVASWKSALIYAAVFGLASIIFFWPMIPDKSTQSTDDSPEVNTNKEGLTTFLRHWQMNEFAYMLVYQNLRELDPDQNLNRPWFRITNESTRRSLLKTVNKISKPEDAAYVLSRLITLGAFALFCGGLLFRFFRSRQEVASDFLSGCFWTLAVFFCLQPTQNPWYWTWAIPLLPFCRNRGWILYTTFLLFYYARFWLAQFDGPFHVLGQQYDGAGLFDYVLVWLEHLPVLILVAWFSLRGSVNREQPAEFEYGTKDETG